MKAAYADASSPAAFSPTTSSRQFKPCSPADTLALLEVRIRTGFSRQTNSSTTKPLPQVKRLNYTNSGIGFVPGWWLLVHGIRPHARGKPAYETAFGKFYWIEEFSKREIVPNGCEFIIGDIDSSWERCNLPRRKGITRYCSTHYEYCHKTATLTQVQRLV